MAINRLKKLVNPFINYLGAKKVKKDFTKPPILMGGCARSGTTLLLSIIAAHPNIYSFPNESAAFIKWAKKFDKNQNKYKFIPKRIDRFYRYMLIHKIPKEVTRWCEKTPKNVANFGPILDYFDNKVKLIHIIRDGRDVMLSNHPDKEEKYWVNPSRWIRDVKAGLKYKDHSQVLTIKYEDLIMSHKKSIEKICDFIDEECTSELFSWFKHTSIKESAAWTGSVRKVHSKSVQKWKRPENKERVAEVMQNEEVVRLLDELDYL